MNLFPEKIRKFFYPDIIEAPIKLKRAAKEPYIIRKGMVFRFKGQPVETIKDELIKPNNRFRYLEMRPARISFYIKYFFRYCWLHAKHFFVLNMIQFRKKLWA